MPAIASRIRWIWVLVVWTIFLWLSRLRNVLANDELTSGGRTLRILVVVIFVVLALATAAGQRRRWGFRVLATFLIWTVGYWLVRGVGILVDGEYSGGFKVVHTILMLVSLTLSALTAREARLGR